MNVQFFDHEQAAELLEQLQEPKDHRDGGTLVTVGRHPRMGRLVIVMPSVGRCIVMNQN